MLFIQKAAWTDIQAAIGPGCWLVLLEQADVDKITLTLVGHMGNVSEIWMSMK